MQIHTFLHVTFQEGAWKQGWPEAGRITYKASQDHANVEIVCSDQDQRLGFQYQKGTKIAVTGNSIHLPSSMR